MLCKIQRFGAYFLNGTFVTEFPAKVIRDIEVIFQGKFAVVGYSFLGEGKSPGPINCLLIFKKTKIFSRLLSAKSHVSILRIRKFLT